MRGLAREVAFKVIHGSLFCESTKEDLTEYYEFDNLTQTEDLEFVQQLVGMFFDNKQEVEEKISSNLKDFTLDRIYKIDRAIISLAIVEFFYFKETPKSVIINEAVKMAKRYGTEKSYSFVNGILKNILEG